MSLLGSLSDALKNAARGALSGALNYYATGGTSAGGANIYGALVQGSAAGILGGSPSTPGAGGAVSGLSNSLVGSLDPTVEGSIGDYMIPDALVGTSCSPKTLKSGRVRYPRHRANGSCYFPRRMNPLNPRAARRAIRRIKAVRRITRDIERSLPRVATRRR